MRKELDRSRVKGFLDTDGRRIINEAGEEVILTGWGLGNWLLCEGYMWLAGNKRFDRPRNMETVIEELTGKEFAAGFWKKFRDRYITENDIRLMAEMGYNSVRIPINARLFVNEGPGIHFLDEGFELLDRVIDWCETYKLYAFIDLHGAPGGQTGANIDDSIDDVCRLFADQDQFDKGIALWEKLAERYADRWIVGGYDILNEPIRPVRFEGDSSLESYVPRLKEFYEKSIERIRVYDKRHLLSIEGHHWATRTDIFDHVYDPKMVIHFHRYACPPDKSSFEQFLKLSEELNVPLWLGETGENTMEWFSAMMPLACELGIGINMWPWKKMRCVNSPCSVNPPKDWQMLIDYSCGGVHPGYEKAQSILEEYLDNMLLENCHINDDVSANVFRVPGCIISGTDFDETPGADSSYKSVSDSYPKVGYRENTGMQLYRRFPERGGRFAFDGEWAQYVLCLASGEFACYTLYDASANTELEIACYASEDAMVEISQDERVLGRFELNGAEDVQTLAGMRLEKADISVLRVAVVSGTVDVELLRTANR